RTGAAARDSDVKPDHGSIHRLVGLATACIVVACQQTGGMSSMSSESRPAVAPVAAMRPMTIASPHGTRTDPYYWLRDDTRSDGEVLAYLRAENAYADAMLAHTRPLQEQLYEEIVGRIKQDDSSVPYRKRGYWYYTRFETGKEYPIHARKKGTLEAPEEILLDVNVMAEGHEFFQVAAYSVSPDNRMLAWAEDTVGRRQYTVRFKNLETGEVLPDVIVNAEASMAWAADSR